MTTRDKASHSAPLPLILPAAIAVNGEKPSAKTEPRSNTAQGEISIGRARMADVPAIHQIVTIFADRGEMLHRPLPEIYENLRDFSVARLDGEVIGCVALHFLWADLAEIKSLAVREDRQLGGVGASLVRACLTEAREVGLPRVFALTYKPRFFEKLGFELADVNAFPQKVWGECYRCPKFPSCTEIALSIDLSRE
ncbi:MAG: N-acetyltransferase [Dehalococcoidia bacterium]